VHFACARRGGDTVHTRIGFGAIGRDQVRMASASQALEMLLAAAGE